MYARYFKRLVDIIFAVIISAALLPLAIVAAICIKLESKGPVLFRAKRIGRHEKDFTIYKFRSMRVDAPVLPPNKIGDAAKYMTRVGQFIRKTSLDELPQVWNVLIGDMSFVGPRPGASHNEEELRLERRRRGVFSVRPGITGWAQVNGRDELAKDVVAKSRADQYYVEHLTIGMDILCLLRTFKVVGTGAGYEEGRADSRGSDK